MKLWAVTMGIGAAVGAVAILMMPKTNPTRQLATKAACKVEDTAYRVGDAISQKMGLQ
jgi:gas vesicle protein